MDDRTAKRQQSNRSDNQAADGFLRIAGIRAARCRDLILRSLRARQYARLIFCAVLAALVYLAGAAFTEHALSHVRIDSAAGRRAMEEQAGRLAGFFDQISRMQQQGRPDGLDAIQPDALQTRIGNQVSEASDGGRFKVLVTDAAGTVRYASDGASEQSVDLQTAIRQALDEQAASAAASKDGTPYLAMRAAQVLQSPGYVLLSGVPEAAAVSVPAAPWLPGLLAAAAFLLLYGWLARTDLQAIAAIEERLRALPGVVPQPRHRRDDELGRLDSALDELADRLAAQEQERRRQEAAERTLIANLAHDLRTQAAELTEMTSMASEGPPDSRNEEAEGGKAPHDLHAKAERLHRLTRTLFDWVKRG